MKLGLFPLPVFLLPQGVTKLRIFEQRYIRLVQESAGDIGFVIASPHMTFDPPSAANNWGSWVKIIDFCMGDDGLLLIDVKCQSMVKINSMEIESDGLKKGDVSLYSHWVDASFTPMQQDAHTIQKQLHLLFQQNPQLSELYEKKHFSSLVWVCQRWLELLPLKPNEQNLFVQSDSFDQCYQFLRSVILE